MPVLPDTMQVSLPTHPDSLVIAQNTPPQHDLKSPRPTTRAPTHNLQARYARPRIQHRRKTATSARAPQSNPNLSPDPARNLPSHAPTRAPGDQGADDDRLPHVGGDRRSAYRVGRGESGNANDKDESGVCFGDGYAQPTRSAEERPRGGSGWCSPLAGGRRGERTKDEGMIRASRFS